jgi:hypothetical protein
MDENEQEVTGREVGILEGEFVRISRSSIRSVEGGHIEMEQVCALSVDGEKVDSAQSASVMISGGEIALNQSMSLFAAGNKTKIRNSCVPFSFARENASVKKSAAGIVAAGTVQVENSTTLLLLAKNVEGDVNTVFDWKSAAAFGAVLGGVLGLFTFLKKR